MSSRNGHVPHHVDVQIHKPFTWTPASLAYLEEVFGEPLEYTPPDIEGPWLTVNDVVFGPSVNWLARRAEKSPSTRSASERALRCLVDWRCNHVVGVYRPDDEVTWEKRILEMSDDEYGEFKAWMLHDRDDPVTENVWNGLNSALINFYEAVEGPWGIDMPFDLESVEGTYRTYRSNGWACDVSTGSASNPLTPDFCEALLQGAWRLDNDDNDSSTPVSSRDAALIRYGLGTGMRRESLVSTTHYEVPPKTDDVLTLQQVAHATAKAGRGGSALGFEHHVQQVRQWVNGGGGRSLLVEQSKQNHKPEDPIYITKADLDGWEGTTADGKPIKKKLWWRTNGATRRRLVDIDGSSPILFLTDEGRPMSLRNASRRIQTAVEWTKQNVETDFPEGFRLHDLRHTFAVHMAVVTYHDIVDERVAHTARGYSDRDLKSAIQLVTVSLTHTSSETTVGTYLVHAGQQLRVIGRAKGEERAELLAAYTGEDV